MLTSVSSYIKKQAPHRVQTRQHCEHRNATISLFSKLNHYFIYFSHFGRGGSWFPCLYCVLLLLHTNSGLFYVNKKYRNKDSIRPTSLYMPTRLIPCFMVPDPQKKPMPVHASMVSIVIINSLIDYVICNCHNKLPYWLCYLQFPYRKVLII